jgi:hypothetical protein
MRLSSARFELEFCLAKDGLPGILAQHPLAQFAHDRFRFGLGSTMFGVDIGAQSLRMLKLGIKNETQNSQ